MKLIVLAAAVLAATMALAGCRGGTSGHAASRVSAAATSTPVKNGETIARMLLKPCLPANLVTLLGKEGRARFAGCLEIPKANRSAFETAVSQSAETAHLATRAGRDTFAQVTLPQLIAEYR
jgi:hypothetical protein